MPRDYVQVTIRLYRGRAEAAVTQTYMGDLVMDDGESPPYGLTDEGHEQLARSLSETIDRLVLFPSGALARTLLRALRSEVESDAENPESSAPEEIEGRRRLLAALEEYEREHLAISEGER